MALSRRAFVRTLSVGGAGVLSADWITGRGREAFAGTADLVGAAPEGGSLPVIRISSNENPNGPGQVVLDAVRAAFPEANRYPGGLQDRLTKEIARVRDVTPENLMIGVGSGEVIYMSVLGFTSATRPLVVGSPTFEDPARIATALGAPVIAVPVDGTLRLDLEGMAAKAAGAGLVYICNPNNPTATVHGAKAIDDVVAKILKASPATTILVDEAYHEYVDDPAYRTAMPLALANPRVIVARTFSKVYGMAGLRVGYAVAMPETAQKLRGLALRNNMGALGLAAATVAIGDLAHVEKEKVLNREARDYTRRSFESMGFTVIPSEANFMMIDIKRDSREFQQACAKYNVLVGRPFPPLTTHARVSVGTMDEMRQAMEVFRKVLGKTMTTARG